MAIERCANLAAWELFHELAKDEIRHSEELVIIRIGLPSWALPVGLALGGTSLTP